MEEINTQRSIASARWEDNVYSGVIISEICGIQKRKPPHK